jgi:hypothetical protein
MLMMLRMLRMLRMLSKWWGRPVDMAAKFTRHGQQPRGALARWSPLGNTATNNNNAVDFTKSASEGQGDADSDVVGALKMSMQRLKADGTRGLDNAGKTTIVKKIMGEDVNSVSPTLGFIIKTIEYDG